MCTKFSVDHPGQCRDDDSDYVEYKDQANFCNLFRPNPLAFSNDRAAAGDSALEELQSLFGDAPEASQNEKRPNRREQAKESLSELERLFGGGEDKKS